jgi:transcriptional regulator with XRE-family HTH domain
LDSAFGKILKLRRNSVNLSQERLGLESGLSRSYISDLENGKKDPSLFTIFKLANALDLKPSALIGEVEHTI